MAAEGQRRDLAGRERRGRLHRVVGLEAVGLAAGRDVFVAGDVALLAGQAVLVRRARGLGRGAQVRGEVADQPRGAVAVGQAVLRAVDHAREAIEVIPSARAVRVGRTVGAAVVHALLAGPADLALGRRRAARHAGVGGHVAQLGGLAVAVGQAPDILLADAVDLVADLPLRQARAGGTEHRVLRGDALEKLTYLPGRFR